MSNTPSLAPAPLSQPRAGSALRLPQADSLSAFGWRVSRQFSQSRREGGQLALLWVEIDVVPAPGAPALGDKERDTLIQTVSLRLRNRVRGADEVVRMGDCSFAVLLLAAGAPEARLVEQRLLQALRGTYDVEGCLPQVSVRLGVAVFPHAGQTGAELAEAARDNVPPAASR